MSELADLLGYQLHFTNLVALCDARAALAIHDVTPAKVTAMLFVRDNPGCDQSTLGRLLSINRSSAMKLVNTLCARGLVRRLQGRDLRSNGLHLTEDGSAFLRQVIGVLREADMALSAGLSPAERAELLRLLGKVRASAGREEHPAAGQDGSPTAICEQRKAS